MSVLRIDADLRGGSDWSHVYHGSFVENAVYPLC